MTTAGSGSGAEPTPGQNNPPPRNPPPSLTNRPPSSQPPSHGAPKQPGEGVPKTRAGYAWVGLVIAAVLGILVLVFILQNLEQVSMNVLAWEWNLPKGILVLLSVIAGALFTALVGSTRIVQLRRAAKKTQ
ncbi:LapA family protein [Nocardia aurantiaca]|uniref:DUF1049 domain-containing protein n=1 Tax=Nocardia aurantiaca TaxID=2675850 RepID=A0A6I3KU64_9NOCA|nr:lipopolysaccharide assembly protein LapA domain-containing protein [Nocardia aurantiaca]MTE12911.1 DUF1049 domain-containing protein [Nocardia aurantiaca]